jgi:predicted ATPase
VYWVPLQALRDPALVERAIAGSVGADADLIDHVGSKQLLVLLDNFEQVVEAAPTVSTLLTGTPNAKVLVTSREPLHVESEQRYPVDPLPEDDAALLFEERARAVAPAFEATASEGEICRRLDGLPLAIELAAARVALLHPDELLARLDQRLPLLISRSRAAPERQRTLRATIEWSYELLDPDEQRLFRHVAVFRGSFSLEAAEGACEADLDALESLVVKNLVRRWGSGRLGLLDTIREYAIERLDESPEAGEVRQRHARFFLAVARDARKAMRHDIALAELDNIRGALAWAVRSGSVALGLELATAADWFWVLEDPGEGMRWFEHLLERPEAEVVTPELRAYALLAYAGSTDLSGHDEAAAQLYEQSYALFDQLGDEHGRAVLLHRLGVQAMRRGELGRARQLVEQSHAIHARKDDPIERAWRLGETTGTLGAIARDAGETDRARALIAESAALVREVRMDWWEGGMLAELSALALNAGHVEEAAIHARESLEIAVRLHDRAGRVFAVGLLAAAAAELGQAERAGRLWGAIEADDAVSPLGGWRRHRAECAARIDALPSLELERGLATGREWTLDEAVDYALSDA